MSLEQSVPTPDAYPTDGLTPAEDQELTRLLSKWRGGRISTPVFTELARIVPQPILEVVILRTNNSELETLLIPRPKDEIVWPNMYHTPGTAMRTSDYHRPDGIPLNGAFERIQTGELNNRFADTPQFAGNFQRNTKRGPEFGVAYVAELEEKAQIKPGHLWYPVSLLSENPQFIQHQLGHIKMAADVYSGRP